LIKEKYGFTPGENGGKEKTEAERVQDEIDWLEKGEW